MTKHLLTPDTQEGTLPPVKVQPEVGDVPSMTCRACVAYNTRYIHSPRSTTVRLEMAAPDGTTLRGVIECGHDGHRWPLVIRNNIIVDISPDMPLRASQRLSERVPEDLRQDIEEADEAFHYGLLKSAVVLARRAIQLSIEEHLPDDVLRRRPRWTLGPLLEALQALPSPSLQPNTYAMALGVKDIGDAGAHRRSTIEPHQVVAFVSATVDILNELYAAPATQSRQGSSAQ